MKHNAIVVLSTLVGGLVVSLVAMRWLVPRMSIAAGAYLRDTLEGAKSPQLDEPRHSELLGEIGIVVAPLRPIGRISLGGIEQDAASDGELLPIGTRVVVVAVRPGELVVRRAPESENDAT